MSAYKAISMSYAEVINEIENRDKIFSLDKQEGSWKNMLITI